jgi:hypothetical protein
MFDVTVVTRDGIAPPPFDAPEGEELPHNAAALGAKPATHVEHQKSEPLS